LSCVKCFPETVIQPDVKLMFILNFTCYNFFITTRQMAAPLIFQTSQPYSEIGGQYECCSVTLVFVCVCVIFFSSETGDSELRHSKAVQFVLDCITLTPLVVGQFVIKKVRPPVPCDTTSAVLDFAADWHRVIYCSVSFHVFPNCSVLFCVFPTRDIVNFLRLI